MVSYPTILKKDVLVGFTGTDDEKEWRLRRASSRRG